MPARQTSLSIHQQVNLLTRQLANLSTCQLVNLFTCQPVNPSTRELIYLFTSFFTSLKSLSFGLTLSGTGIETRVPFCAVCTGSNS